MKVQLTKEQLAEMGYTKWEKVMAIAFKLVFASVIMAIFSITVLNPIVDPMIPGNGFDHSRRVAGIQIALALFSSAMGVFSAVVACICAVVLLSKLNSINSYRLRSPIIGILISGVSAVVILFSTFIDYGPFRAWVCAAAGVVLIICMITAFCIYQVRYRRTVEALVNP